MSKAKPLKRVLLVGGGSGGHIIPNLALGDTLKAQHPKVELIYVGSRRALDRTLIPREVPFYGIFAGKLRRYFSWQNFIDPFVIVLGIIQSIGILLKTKPNVVFSKGGYVSLPMNIAAWLTRTKLVLHESDSRMGLANRLSATLASTLCVAFPNLKEKYPKAVVTGNPTRPELKEGKKEKGYELTHFNSKKPVVLIWGGSQGAQQINDLVENEFEKLVARFQIIHIAGAHKQNTRKHANYVQYEYVEGELKHLYAISNVAIGRAGANSLFELASLEIPIILLPLRNADQQGNASYFADQGAAIIFDQEQSLTDQIADLLGNPQKVNAMKAALKTLATPEASEAIVKTMT